MGQRGSMKLLTSEVGWSATGSQLFWTTSAGTQWKDITPPTTAKEEITSVFFLDTSIGWVLLVGDAPDADEPRFDIASTADAGTTWSITHVKIPNLNPDQTTLAGDGRIGFVDPLHGWMNLGFSSSANFRLGGLLATSDGGKSWDWAPDSPGISGTVRLVSVKDGWVAGGPGNHQLYVTHDGGNTWKELLLKAPTEVYPATNPVYDLPTFEDSKHGHIAVTYSGPEGSGLALVVFATADGGLTWNSEIVLSHLPEIYGGVPFPSTLVDSVLITL